MDHGGGEHQQWQAAAAPSTKEIATEVFSMLKGHLSKDSGAKPGKDGGVESQRRYRMESKQPSQEQVANLPGDRQQPPPTTPRWMPALDQLEALYGYRLDLDPARQDLTRLCAILDNNSKAGDSALLSGYLRKHGCERPPKTTRDKVRAVYKVLQEL